jgi:uncharacterized protein YdcH (DUF465 family)
MQNSQHRLGRLRTMLLENVLHFTRLIDEVDSIADELARNETGPDATPVPPKRYLEAVKTKKAKVPKVPCPECDVPVDPRGLRSHRRSHATPTPARVARKPFRRSPCPDCGRMTDPRGMKGHRAVHRKGRA